MSCFMCNIFLCHLILSDLLCLWSPFCRLRIVVPFASGVCSRWVRMVQRLVVKTPPLFCGCNCPIRSRVCSLVVRVEDTRSVYFLFIYLFIYLFGCVGSWLWYVGSSLCYERSFIATHRLSSCGTWAPGCVGSVTAASWLIFSVAYGFLCHNQGSNPHSLHCKVNY